MSWLLFALLSPALHGLSNLIDNHFSNVLFKRIASLIFYSSITNLLFLPLVFLVEIPHWINLEQVPYFLILGLTGIFYLYPYYKALQHQDTSVVVSLFSLGKIFVPVLAYFLVGEVLSLEQYLGFFIIVFSAAILSLRGIRKLKFNSSFLWMGLCTLILAVESVIFKEVFSQVSWSTGFTWATVFSFLFILLALLVPTKRRFILLEFPVFKKHFGLFALEEFFNFAGSATFTLAISLASVSLVSALSSLQSIMVLLYALIMKRFFPKAFKEDISFKSLIKKAFLFLIMMLGVTIILINGG